MLDHFHRIWDLARGEHFAPRWRDLNFDAFPAKMLPYMYLVDVLREPFRFQYRFIGTRVCELEGWDYTNKFVHDLKPEKLGIAVAEEFKKFAEDPKPVFFMMMADEEANTEGLYRVYGGVRLPLSNDGVNLTHIISLAQFERDNKDLRDCFYERLKDSA